MPDGGRTLGELADQVRSKNAGPFWITLDIFFADEDRYRLVASSGALSKEAIGRLYRVDPEIVKYFELPNVLALKISFPRSVTAGSFEDRDLHAGQQHVPLLGLRIPAGPPEPPRPATPPRGSTPGGPLRAGKVGPGGDGMMPRSP